jgi:adenine-specific DNA glycosylase
MVVHVFTHFRLELRVLAAKAISGIDGGASYWCPIDRLDSEPLPSLMRKVIERGFARSAKRGDP